MLKSVRRRTLDCSQVRHLTAGRALGPGAKKLWSYVRRRTDAAPAGGKNAVCSMFTKFRRSTMLYTLAVVLIVLWLLGLVTSTTMGGFIHILLVVAIVMILLRLISGRGPL